MNNTKNTFAVVTTVADDPINIELFVRYHLEIGAEKVFVFLDDNNLTSFENLQNIEKVKVFLRTPALMDNWKLISLHERALISKDAAREVMYRQCMNFGIASAYARLEGIDWLLHLDGDELFYPNGTDLAAFFRSLKQNNVGACRFLNYECIPQREELGHHFDECRTFKVNSFHYHGYEEAGFNYHREQKEFIEGTPWLQNKFFNFYANGKSATNLSEEFQIIGVHCTVPDNGNIHTAHKTDPLILHYPCSSFRSYKEKYKRLGDFVEYWFSDPLHIESKNLFSGDDESKARHYYDYYMALDKERIAALDQRNLIITIDAVANIMSKIKHSLITEYSNCIIEPTVDHPERSASPIFRFDITTDIQNRELFLSFTTIEQARRWVRRMLPKGLFSNYEIVPLRNDCFFIKINGSYAIDLSELKNIELLASDIMSNAHNNLCLSGINHLYTKNYADVNSVNINADRYRQLMKLTQHLKTIVPNISISLDSNPQSPMIIPLMDKNLVYPVD